MKNRDMYVDIISNLQDTLIFIYNNSKIDLDSSDLSCVISDIYNYIDNDFDNWDDENYFIEYIKSLTEMVNTYMKTFKED